MGIQPTNIRLYHESLERIARTSPQFLNRLYVRFMESDAATTCVFRGRPMEQATRKLQTTLDLATDNVDGVLGTDMYLELLCRMHERRHITQAQFQCWKTALLAAVAECDPAFAESTRLAWHEVLDALIEKMHDAATVAGGCPFSKPASPPRDKTRQGTSQTRMGKSLVQA